MILAKENYTYFISKIKIFINIKIIYLFISFYIYKKYIN